MNSLGERLKILRTKNCITQKYLSESTSISPANLSKYESDKMDPSASSIIKLAEFYRVSSDWILFGENRISDSSKEDNGQTINDVPIKLSDREIDLISNFRKLPSDLQERYIGRIEGASENY